MRVLAIKLFVTDLDGTLLNRRHEISEANRLAVRRAVERGVVATIATGRMYASALPYAKRLEVDVPIITYNGALIKSAAGEVWFEKCLAPETVADVYALCRRNGWYVQTYKDDTLYFAARDARAHRYETAAGIKGEAVGDALYKMTARVPKMLLITEGGAQSDAYVEEIKKALGARVFATKSNPEYIEIVHPDVNKAAALSVLMERLDLTRAQVMAIGDSNNDLPMLKAAGLSVAMGNAAEHIQSLCADVTADCDEDGVALAIEKHILCM